MLGCLLITGQDPGCPSPPQGHWTTSINKSVAVTGSEMPLGEGMCTISELEFSTSLLSGSDREREAMSIRITDIHLKVILRCMSYLPT